MYDFPPMTLYNCLWSIKVPGAPYWKYDGQFVWIPKAQGLFSKDLGEQ